MQAPPRALHPSASIVSSSRMAVVPKCGLRASKTYLSKVRVVCSYLFTRSPYTFTGLREYWDSPWATYSQSRGRSRWRNQFLVDYLQKAGINRTKKQVASHIQVLRNMWKGEPGAYLRRLSFASYLSFKVQNSIWLLVAKNCTRMVLPFLLNLRTVMIQIT